MEKRSTDVLAENLRRLMEQTPALGTQMQLAQAAQVDQKTISNCLRPALRQPSAKGRVPSPTLSNLEKIAAAFGLQVWQILIPDGFEETAEAVPAPEGEAVTQ